MTRLLDYSSIISILSLLVSIATFFFAFFLNSRRELKKRQREVMNILASRLCCLNDLYTTVLSAKANGVSIDPFLFPQMCIYGERMESSIDEAFGLGLYQIIVGLGNGRRQHLLLHTVFVGALQSAIQTGKNTPEPWLKQHFAMGMLRLLDNTRKYKYLDAYLDKELKFALKRDLLDNAWTYASDQKG